MNLLYNTINYGMLILYLFSMVFYNNICIQVAFWDLYRQPIEHILINGLVNLLIILDLIIVFLVNTGTRSKLLVI